MSWRLPIGAKIGMLGANLEELNIPTEQEYADLYYKRTGRNKIENWSFYMAYNIFRLAGISQGIVGRVRDGTASSAQAKEFESFVPILAKIGWSMVKNK
jgi:aminoglycoside phosphotransferase (APT) family kinase protein